MSTSANTNMSLTMDSNPKPTSRRRSVVVAEKKSSAEMHAEAIINGVADDKMISNGKDLSHTIHGEAVHETPKDPSQLRKGLVTSTITSRHKKAVPKPKISKWQTALSILTKNVLLLAALLWLGQTIWRWTGGNGGNSQLQFGVLDYEGRISEVEAFFKKTAKMLQVQLEVVDRKIGSEIGLARRELAKQVEERDALLEKELKKLEARTDTLDKSLGELKDMGLLSKKEFDMFWNELKKSRSLDSGYTDVSLDDIRAYAKHVVEKEIEKHAADGLGRVDYAIASGGAKVIRHSEACVKADSWYNVAKGKSTNRVSPRASKMLEPSFGQPGECFCMQGSIGFVEIRLRGGIVPEAFTLEHVSKSVAFDWSSAPKDCRVFGWFKGFDDHSTEEAEKMILLAEYTYDHEKGNAQTFNVESTGLGLINTVRLDFTSNYGNPAFTCIYRFRVHGREPSSATAMNMQA